MKARFLLFATAGRIILFQPVAAQNYAPGTFNVNEIVAESMLSLGSDATDPETELRELEWLSEHPVNLNAAEKEDLRKIPFLNDFQIASLLEYRKSTGTLISTNELMAVHGFNDQLILLISPYITLESNLSSMQTGNRKHDIDHDLEIYMHRVIQKARGYKEFDSIAGDTRYPGNPWLISGHYDVRMGDQINAGITVEKDAGEEIFKGSNASGFDYYSGYLQVEKTRFLRAAIAGDYRLVFGQGLTLWLGRSPGKSSMPLSIVKRQDAIKPYRSNDENNFFRGLAASSSFRNFTFTAFFSSKKRDANITDTLSGHVFFSSFQENGYHRSQSEVSDEKSVKEHVFGANLIYRNNHFKAGTTIVKYHFDKFMEKGEDLKDIHDFNGNTLVNVGFDYLITGNKVQLFGETSAGNGHWATLNGMLLPVNKYASFSLLYRYLSAGYFSMNQAVLCEKSTGSNEEGLYAGLVIHPFPKFKISCYADFYRFPWLSYHISAPASGSDYMVQIDYSLSRGTNMYFRVKFEKKPYDDPFQPDSVLIPEVTDLENSGFRYHISYSPVNNLVMQNRLEVTFTGNSKGIMVYQDIQYRLTIIPLRINTRIAWFNTGDYQSRIYAYEHDMTRGYSFAPLYDSGIRCYLMANFALNKMLYAGARYSHTFFSNKQVLGSGYDSVNSSSKSDVKIMLTIRL